MEATKNLPSSGEAQPLVCANGHLLTVGQAFCPTCGSAARNEYARPEWDLLNEKPTKTPKPKTDNQKIVIVVVSIVVALALAIAVVTAVSHRSGQSYSYKAGYSEGAMWANSGRTLGFWASGETNASGVTTIGNACQGYALQDNAPAPAYNETQYIAGCEAGWNANGQ